MRVTDPRIQHLVPSTLDQNRSYGRKLLSKIYLKVEISRLLKIFRAGSIVFSSVESFSANSSRDHVNNSVISPVIG
jgi:hypothetical protein